MDSQIKLPFAGMKVLSASTLDKIEKITYKIVDGEILLDIPKFYGMEEIRVLKICIEK